MNVVNGDTSANAGAVASGTNKIFQCAPGSLVAKRHSRQRLILYHYADII